MSPDLAFALFVAGSYVVAFVLGAVFHRWAFKQAKDATIAVHETATKAAAAVEQAKTL